jgi:hypothetical protein
MKMKRINVTRGVVLLVVASATFLLAGCSSGGEFRGQNTDAGVSLSKRNYRVIKAGAKGEGSGFWLFGIIPFSSPSYAKVKGAMYESVGEKLEGRAIALVNQTEDRASRYFILFSLPKLTITADVIEYLDEHSSSK